MAIWSFRSTIKSCELPSIIPTLINNGIHMIKRRGNHPKLNIHSPWEHQPTSLIYLGNNMHIPKIQIPQKTFSLASTSQVSTTNTTIGSCARIKSSSSWTVWGFPSPWQFQQRRFMALGGAGHQPPPLTNHHLFLIEKPFSSSLVTQIGRAHVWTPVTV